MERIVAAGPDILSFLWFPVLIWTFLTVVVLAGLKLLFTIHVQYHYHVRLGLILALPAGLIMAGLASLADSYFITTEQASAPFRFIIVSPPIEITGSEPQNGLMSIFASTWQTIIAWLIVIGSAIQLFRYFSHYLHLNRLSRTLPLFPLSLMEAISDRNKTLAKKSGGNIHLAILHRPVVPVTYGLRKPVILLPSSLTKSVHKMNIVISHELTHILNRDYLIHMVVMGIKALFWYHPLVHRVAKQLEEYREMRCDNLVLADKNVSPKEYASILLEMTPLSAMDTRPALNFAQSASNLKRRIQRMNVDRFRHLSFRSAFSSFGTIFTAIALVMAGTDLQHPEQVDTAGPPLAFESELLEMNLMNQSAGTERDLLYQNNLDSGTPQPPQRPPVPVRQPENEMVAISELPPIPALSTIPAARINPNPADNLNNLSYNPQPGDVHTIVEQMPELIGGLASIQQSIRYPEIARRAGVEGRVMVQFIITEDGKVENPEVIRGIGGGCDREALRAVQLAEFKPGYQHGQPVRVQYMIPIYFRLQGVTS